MARLRDVCAAVGAENVRTYIASGNVVLDSRLAPATLRTRLEAELAREFGFPTSVIVLTAPELAEVVKRNPYEKAETGTVHVAFAFGDLDKKTTDRLESIGSDSDEAAAVVGRQIYFRLPHGFGGVATLGLVVSKMKPPVTIRTWRTVLALDKLATEGA